MGRTHVPTRGSPAYVEMRKQLASLDVLSVAQSAIYLGVSIHTIYKLIANKAFPFSKPNHKNIFIVREDLDEWRLQNLSDKQKTRKHINNHFLKNI